jgi:hypothetical protein
MGFDWEKIRLLKNAYSMRELNFTPFTPNEIEIVSNKAEWNGSVESFEEPLNFKPHFGWVGAIENSRRALSA